MVKKIDRWGQSVPSHLILILILTDHRERGKFSTQGDHTLSQFKTRKEFFIWHQESPLNNRAQVFLYCLFWIIACILYSLILRWCCLVCFFEWLSFLVLVKIRLTESFLSYSSGLLGFQGWFISCWMKTRKGLSFCSWNYLRCCMWICVFRCKDI